MSYHELPTTDCLSKAPNTSRGQGNNGLNRSRGGVGWKKGREKKKGGVGKKRKSPQLCSCIHRKPISSILRSVKMNTCRGHTQLLSISSRFTASWPTPRATPLIRSPVCLQGLSVHSRHFHFPPGSCQILFCECFDYQVT